MTKIITKSEDDSNISQFYEDSRYLIISGTYFRYSENNFTQRCVNICNLSIEDIELYKGEGDMYDGSALVCDWRKNHDGIKIFKRFINDTDIINYSNVINILFGIESIIVGDNKGKIRGKLGGRPKNIVWIHKLLFVRLAEKMSPLLGIKMMSLLVNGNDLLTINNCINKNIFDDKLFIDNKIINTYIAIDESDRTIIKIGKTVDLKHRESSLRCSNPNLFIIYYVERDIEDELHLKYESRLYKGEWFFLDKEEVMDIVNEHKFKRYAKHRKCLFFET